MAKVENLLFVTFVLLASIWKCHTLRCRTDDGPTEEEIKKVVRTCMRKLGDDSNENNSDDSYEHSNETNDNKSNNYNNENNNKRGNRFRRHADMMVDRWQQQQGYDNAYGNRNLQRYDNGDYGNNGNNGNDFGNYFQNNGNSNYENNRNYNLQTERQS